VISKSYIITGRQKFRLPVVFSSDAAEDETKWSQKNWEDLLLKMLSKSLDEVDDEDWVSELGESMGEQINLYHSAPEEKVYRYSWYTHLPCSLLMFCCDSKQDCENNASFIGDSW
jgi:hypothetical protein